MITVNTGYMASPSSCGLGQAVYHRYTKSQPIARRLPAGALGTFTVNCLPDEVLRHLTAWFAARGRELPWRSSADPYRVWVSEIMLQQTRIETVIPYYERFLRELPDVRALAQCGEERLLKLWEGLGYYSRVRNMRRCAQVLCEQYDGTFPAQEQALRDLPGIGPYTAGAIASICFDLPVPAVDGNVLRVLSRLYDDREDVMQTAVRRRAEDLVRRSLERTADLGLRPGDLTQGIMELGETVCLAGGAPACDACPLAAQCLARQRGTQAALPVRVVKTRRRVEMKTVLVMTDSAVMTGSARVLLHRRPETGLLAGLYELPALEGELSEAEILDALRQQEPAAEILRAEKLTGARHLFSHLEWRMTGWRITLTEEALQAFAAHPDCVAAGAEDLAGRYPLPSAFAAFRPYLPGGAKQ